jgi:hypothetical protein
MMSFHTVFGPMKAMSSEDDNNELIILLNKALNIIYNLYND